MTSYLKNSLRLGILFFGISLLWNCENIDGPIVEKTGEDQATAQSHNIKSIGNLNSLRPIIETIKAIRPTDTYSAKGTGSKNELDNINVDRIIQYTDETGFSTYTFKIENGLESINFENLHLVETENGYIGYILSYEPDVDWYNGILEDIGYFYFDISTFQGHITKYSLEREVIWSTNNGPTTKSSKSTTTAKRGGSGNFVQVCITTSPEPCLEGRHNDSTGWDDCDYSDGHWGEACESVWVSGGLHPQDNPDYEGNGGGGSTSNGGTCTNTSGTGIVNSQPISGISTGCAPNNTVGFDIAAAYTAFWMDLVFAQQNYLNLYPDIKTSVLKYLYDSKYAPQAQNLAKGLIDETYVSLVKNGLTVEAVAVFDYLFLNDWSYEARNFANAAIDALMSGGDIDLENRLIYNPLIAQDYRARMSSAEEVIFDSLNTLQKEGYLRAATQAYIYAETHFSRPVRNTKGDTFKHTFWNALSTVYIGEVLTEQLTTAHEEIDYDPNYPNHFKETQMDLFNNSKGRQIAYGAGRLYQLVQNAMDRGNLKYLSNLEFINGFWRATNSSQLIPSNQ